MNIFFTILKTQFNSTFGLSALKYRFTKEKKRLWEPILVALSIIVGGGVIVFFLSLFMYGFFLASKVIGKPELVITIAFMGSQFVVLFFGIAYILGTFYFARDMDILIPLPIKPWHVLGSKFALVMFGEYLTVLPLLLPAVIIYGTGTGQGLFYWIKSLVVIFAAPIIPLSIAAIFVVVMMRFINVRKSKDILTVIGSFFAILMAMGWNALIQRIPKTGGQEDFYGGLLKARMGLIEQTIQKYPPGIWVTNGLSNTGINGLGDMLLFLGVSTLLFIVLMWLGDRVFYKSFLSGQEVVRRRKVLSEVEFDRRFGKIYSPIRSIFQREWRIFLRTPVFIVNGITGMVIAPFLIIIPLITNSEETESLLEMLNKPEFTMYITLGTIGVTLLTCNLGILANTAVSREGYTFWISKLIPVSPREQVLGKFLHAISVELLGIVVVVITVGIVFRLPLYSLFVILVLSTLGNVFLASVNLLIDVARPKLDWTNPQEAVKQNLNSIFGIFVTMLVIAVFAILSVIFVVIKIPEFLIYTLLGLLTIALSILSITGLFVIAQKRYKDIEI